MPNPCGPCDQAVFGTQIVWDSDDPACIDVGTTIGVITTFTWPGAVTPDGDKYPHQACPDPAVIIGLVDTLGDPLPFDELTGKWEVPTTQPCCVLEWCVIDNNDAVWTAYVNRQPGGTLDPIVFINQLTGLAGSPANPIVACEDKVPGTNPINTLSSDDVAVTGDGTGGDPVTASVIIDPAPNNLMSTSPAGLLVDAGTALVRQRESEDIAPVAVGTGDTNAGPSFTVTMPAGWAGMDVDIKGFLLTSVANGDNPLRLISKIDPTGLGGGADDGDEFEWSPVHSQVAAGAYHTPVYGGVTGATSTVTLQPSISCPPSAAYATVAGYRLTVLKIRTA